MSYTPYFTLQLSSIPISCPSPIIHCPSYHPLTSHLSLHPTSPLPTPRNLSITCPTPQISPTIHSSLVLRPTFPHQSLPHPNIWIVTCSAPHNSPTISHTHQNFIHHLFYTPHLPLHLSHTPTSHLSPVLPSTSISNSTVSPLAPVIHPSTCHVS